MTDNESPIAKVATTYKIRFHITIYNKKHFPTTKIEKICIFVKL